MAVLSVVPGKECLAMASGVFDAAKALREVGAVFHGLELRFRIRVVIGCVGAAVALGLVRNPGRKSNGEIIPWKIFLKGFFAFAYLFDFVALLVIFNYIGSGLVSLRNFV